jgi:hypothetical protein
MRVDSMPFLTLSGRFDVTMTNLDLDNMIKLVTSIHSLAQSKGHAEILFHYLPNTAFTNILLDNVWQHGQFCPALVGVLGPLGEYERSLISPNPLCGRSFVFSTKPFEVLLNFSVFPRSLVV